MVAPTITVTSTPLIAVSAARDRMARMIAAPPSPQREWNVI